MSKSIKIISLALILLLSVSLTAQVNKQSENIELKFLKDKLNIEPGKSFFNILKITNNTTSEQEFNLQFNIPQNWEIIGNMVQKIIIMPSETLNIPVRVVVSKDAKGGVGYAVIAAITDENGSIIDSEYAFLQIPVRSKIEVETSKRSVYIGHKTKSSKFSVTIKNTGNIDEIISLNMQTDNSIEFIKKNGNFIEGNGILVDEIEVPMKTEKTIDYTIKVKGDIDLEQYKFHRIKIDALSNDTVVKRTVWFQYLDWKYENNAFSTIYPLNIRLIASDVFSTRKTIYGYSIFGKILLKKKRDVTYSFRNQNRNSDIINPWINSRINIKYTTPKTEIKLGDYLTNSIYVLPGRGVSIAQSITERLRISGLFTRDLLRPINSYSSSISYNFPVALSLETGGIYTQDIDLGYTSDVIFGSLKTRLLKNNIFAQYGHSNRQIIQDQNTEGWGYRASVNMRHRLFQYSVMGYYATPNYFGQDRGRYFMNANTDIYLSDKNTLTINYLDQRYRPAYVSGNQILSDLYSLTQSSEIVFKRNLSKQFRMTAGVNYVHQTTNTYFAFNPDFRFSTSSSLGSAGLRYNIPYTRNSVSVSGKIGIVNIYEFSSILNSGPAEIFTENRNFNIAEFRFGVKRNFSNTYILYTHGPHNISKQFAFFYSSYFSRSLSLISSYERSLFKKTLSLSITGTLVNNISSKINRLNINTRLNWFVEKGWTFSLFNTAALHHSGKVNSDATFVTTYFQVGVTKSFNFKQPRIKFYDFDAIYYKDLNGNRIHDPNEPGVESVLSEIDRAYPDEDIDNPNYDGEYVTKDLLSNASGHIQYLGMPEGDYILKYTSQNRDLGAFEAESVVDTFKIYNDTVMHIPFVERNKLFGKINLNRTKHSALGEIPVNNIKITVEGNNRTYSAISDQDGYFEMYIPVADYYKVKINNIFKEHFTLRQDFFIVKFNGYKNFEVSFEFDEKERTIAFDESDFLVDDDDVPDADFSFDDIKIIKQTNLKGVVRDANSLLPTHATVSIFNSNTNQLISETASSNRTGVYFTSFFAGDSYYIKVFAKGYWVVKENLNIQQVTTFENITKDILLNKINIDDEIKMENLKFNQESAGLSPLAKAELDDMLSTMNLNPSIIIEISGHVDGKEALLTDPIQLSDSRAKNVAAYLVSNGLKENRIKIVAKGNTAPKSIEDTNEGRAKNRRVDIKVAGF